VGRREVSCRWQLVGRRGARDVWLMLLRISEGEALDVLVVVVVGIGPGAVLVLSLGRSDSKDAYGRRSWSFRHAPADAIPPNSPAQLSSAQTRHALPRVQLTSSTPKSVPMPRPEPGSTPHRQWPMESTFTRLLFSRIPRSPPTSNLQPSPLYPTLSIATYANLPLSILALILTSPHAPIS
jgi:hypothetical protein